MSKFSKIDWGSNRFEVWQLHLWDDENPPDYEFGDYCHVQPGDTFKDDRYVAQKRLGWGGCSIVWLAWDTLFSQYVALKVLAVSATSLSRTEIAILEKLASRDQQNQRCVVKLLDHFVHTAQRHSHVCIVFEYLGDNLIKLIKLYGPNGLPLRLVKHICLHILDGLNYLHTEFSLIHGNIKPETICLLSPIDPSDDPLKSGTSPILPPKKTNDKEETSKIAESCTISLGQLVLNHDVGSRKSRDNLMGNPDVNSVEPPKSHDNLIGNPDVNSVELPKSHDDLMGNPDVNSVELPKSHDDLIGNCDVNSVESRKKELLESLDHRCKLIDFGHVLSPGKGDRHSVQIMPYRPPEVIFGDEPSFSTSADLWAFACVCFELATGQYLFPAHLDDEYSRDEDHLALMKQHLGRIPPAMIARSMPFCPKWFDKKGNLRRVPTRKRRTIKERLVEDYNFSEKDATELGDFLNWILKYEPTERPTAARCRRHKWFRDVRNEHFIYTSKESGPREETKLKNVNVVEDEHFISKSKECGPRERTKLKNVNVVEDEHFTYKSKENGEYNKYKREKTKKKNVSSSGRRKKAVMETTTNAKAKHCRDRRPNSSKHF